MFSEITFLSKLVPAPIIVSEDILEGEGLGSDLARIVAPFLSGYAFVSLTDWYHVPWLLFWLFQRLGTQRWPKLSWRKYQITMCCGKQNRVMIASAGGTFRKGCSKRMTSKVRSSCREELGKAPQAGKTAGTGPRVGRLLTAIFWNFPHFLTFVSEHAYHTGCFHIHQWNYFVSIHLSTDHEFQGARSQVCFVHHCNHRVNVAHKYLLNK